MEYVGMYVIAYVVSLQPTSFQLVRDVRRTCTCMSSCNGINEVKRACKLEQFSVCILDMYCML